MYTILIFILKFNAPKTKATIWLIGIHEIHVPYFIFYFPNFLTLYKRRKRIFNNLKWCAVVWKQCLNRDENSGAYWICILWITIILDWTTLILTFELDSLGSNVSNILLFLLCASMSTYITDHEAPLSPNKLQPLIDSRALLAMPMEL